MLTSYSVKKPYTIVVIMVIILVLGAVSLINTGVDLLPDMDMPYLVVATISMGASPEVVESEVTQPTEEVLSQLKGIKNITSMSMENISMLILEFENGIDIDSAVLDVREQLNTLDLIDDVSGAYSQLTGGSDDLASSLSGLTLTPLIVKINPSMMPTMMTAISKSGSDSQASAALYSEIIDKVQSVDGVASVSTNGLVENLIFLQFNLDHLLPDLIKQSTNETEAVALLNLFNTLGTDGILDDETSDKITKTITPSLLNTLITAQNLEMPVGTTVENETSYFVKLGDKISSREELESLPLFGLNIGETLEILNDNKIGGDSVFSRETLTSALAVIPLIGDSASTVVDQLYDGIDDEDTIISKTAEGNIKISSFMYGKLYDCFNGQTIYLRLGNITDSFDLDTAGNYITSLNGEPTVTFTVMKQPNASTVEISNDIYKILDSYKETDNSFNYVALYDQGYYINEVIESLITNMVLGAVFAILVLFIFLRRIKPTVLVAFSIFISVVATFVLMYLSGITLNIVSMGGLALGVGMLVDNSIVVIENIYRQKGIGKNKKQAAIDGAKQVVAAIISSTITTIIVFVPLFFTNGIIKTIFKDMALTIAFSLVTSLFFSITMVPMVTTTKLFDKETEIKQKWFDKLREVYSKALKFCLNKKWVSIVIVTVLFGVSVVSAALMGVEFFPMADSGVLSLTVEFDMDKIPENRSYNDVSTDTVDFLNDKILALDYVETLGISESTGLISSIAGDMASGLESSSHTLTGYIMIKDGAKISDSEATKEILDLIKSEDGLYTAEIAGSSSGTDILSSFLGESVSISVYCDDLDDLLVATQKISDTVKSLDNVTNVISPIDAAELEYNLSVDKDKASEYGVYVGSAMMSVMNSLQSGAANGTIKFKGDSSNTNITIYPSDYTIKEWLRAYDENGNTTAVYIEKIYDYNYNGTYKYKYSVVYYGDDITLKNGDVVSNGGSITLKHSSDGAYYYTLLDGTVKSFTPAANGKTYYSAEPSKTFNLVTAPIACITIDSLNDSNALGNIMSGASTVTIPLWKLLSDDCFVKDENGNTIMVYDDDSAEYIPAAIQKTKSSVYITRVNGKRCMSISGSVTDDTDISTVNKAIDKKLAEITLPEGVEYAYEGQFEIINESFNTLYLILGLGIVLIYLVMVAQFQSLKSPFIVMFTIPLAFTGSILALLLCGMNISISGMVGLVILVGVVVNNGIVFVDYANKLVDNGMPLKEALLKTGADRLRPILMTALTTVFGMIAMAFDATEAGAIIRPMAVTAMGGLAYATLLTLFFVPVMYALMNKHRKAKGEVEAYMAADVGAVSVSQEDITGANNSKVASENCGVSSSDAEPDITLDNGNSASDI